MMQKMVKTFFESINNYTITTGWSFRDIYETFYDAIMQNVIDASNLNYDDVEFRVFEKIIKAETEKYIDLI